MGLHLAIIAGETSGDILGARLIAALRQENPDVVFSGVGGVEMTRAGIRSVFPMEDISVMGLSQVLSRLRLIYRRIDETVEAIVAGRPDAIVFIDSPEFAIRVARRVRAKCPEVKTVKYVAPSVWAWRASRAGKMKPYFDLVLGLLPFDPVVFAKLQGPPCRYVGHPAIMNLPAQPDIDAFRRKFEIAADDRILAVLPGSRITEVRRLLKPFGATLRELKRHGAEFRVFIPAVSHLRKNIEAAVSREGLGFELYPTTLTEGEADKKGLLGCAYAALAASGTVTLELALAGVPMVVGYDIDRLLSYFVVRSSKAPSTQIANLVLDKPAIPECLLHRCTPENLSAALVPLLEETNPHRLRQIEDLKRLREIMTPETGDPSLQAAREILDFLG